MHPAVHLAIQPAVWEGARCGTRPWFEPLDQENLSVSREKGGTPIGFDENVDISKVVAGAKMALQYLEGVSDGLDEDLRLKAEYKAGLKAEYDADPRSQGD